MTGDRKDLLVFPADFVLTADVFSGLAHRHIGGRHVLDQCGVWHRIETGHRHTTHGLNTGADENITCIHLDSTRGHMNRLHGRATEPVNGGSGDRNRKPRHEADQPRHVESLLTLGKSTAEDQIFDVIRVNAGTLDQALDDMGGEIIRADLGQGTFGREVKR